MATGTSIGGNTIDVNDEVTIIGTVVAVSGNQITVQGLNSNQQFTVSRQFCYGPTASGAASGPNTVKVGDPITVHTVQVQSIASGVGSSATLNIVLPDKTTAVVAAKDSHVKKTH